MTSKFKLLPDDKILNLLTQSLGFDLYSDKETVIKNSDLILKNVKQLFINLLPEINKYYTKKIKAEYIIDESRCITITRQFLKSRDLDILLVKKMINGEKIKCYKISYKNMRKIKIEKYKPKIISFNDW